MDSLTIHHCLTDLGLSLPGARTIGDNVNALSEETKRAVETEGPADPNPVLSVADETAAWIAKGNRIAVIGYKPQLARSRKGFVAALLVPEGTAADSAMLLLLVPEAMDNAEVKPKLASFDDGYTSEANRAALQEFRVKHVNFSGSKGRDLLGEEAYADPVPTKAGADRSAVESLMFCLKHVHGFGRLRRRGIAAARAELTGKVIAYNMRCAIMLRKAEPEPRSASPISSRPDGQRNGLSEAVANRRRAVGRVPKNPKIDLVRAKWPFRRRDRPGGREIRFRGAGIPAMSDDRTRPEGFSR